MKMTFWKEVNSMERDFYDAKAAKARAIANGKSFYNDGDGSLRCVWCDARATIEPRATGKYRIRRIICPNCEKE